MFYPSLFSPYRRRRSMSAGRHCVGLEHWVCPAVVANLFSFPCAVRGSRNRPVPVLLFFFFLFSGWKDEECIPYSESALPCSFPRSACLRLLGINLRRKRRFRPSGEQKNKNGAALWPVSAVSGGRKSSKPFCVSVDPLNFIVPPVVKLERLPFKRLVVSGLQFGGLASSYFVYLFCLFKSVQSSRYWAPRQRRTKTALMSFEGR